jgi:hypothetical protein
MEKPLQLENLTTPASGPLLMFRIVKVVSRL